MPINLANLRKEAEAITGDRLTQARLSEAAGLSRSAVAVAELRGSLSKWSAEKIARALSVEMGRTVEWYEVFGPDYSPVLDEFWRKRRDESATTEGE